MKNLHFIILFSFIAFFSSCEKDAVMQKREYSFITTIPPKQLSDGVEFMAKVTQFGTDTIKSYGFVWGYTQDSTYTISFDSIPEGDLFTYVLRTGLAKDKKIYVRSFIKTNSHIVYGNQEVITSDITLTPKIYDFEPKSGAIGTQIIIYGDYFVNTKVGNIVRFGGVSAVVDSATNNKIYVKVPEILNNGKVKISVSILDSTLESNILFEVLYPWRKLGVLNQFLGDETISFVINGKGYFGLGRNNKDLWQYIPTLDFWVKATSFPKTIIGYPYCFTINDKAYVLFSDPSAGTLYPNTSIENELWEYNPSANTWTKKASFPGSMRKKVGAVSLNNKGYIIGGRALSTSLREVWEYDPLTDSWLQKANFQYAVESPLVFVYNNTMYAGCGINSAQKNRIHKYDPETDSWSFYTSYPGSGVAKIKSNIINNKCYIGFAYKEPFIDYNDLWEFDVENKIWTKMKQAPIVFNPSFSVVINNKCYMGGYGGYVLHNFEFNPLMQ